LISSIRHLRSSSCSLEEDNDPNDVDDENTNANSQEYEEGIFEENEDEENIVSKI